LLVVVAAMSACGDAGRSTKPYEFQRRADMICSRAARALDDALVPGLRRGVRALGPQPRPAELRRLYAGLLGPTRRAQVIVDDMIRRLRQLDPPRDRAAEYRSLWREIEGTLARSRAAVSEAARDPAAAIVLWEREDSPFENVDTHARRLGLPGCTFDS
jgi:hypothetical protein